MELITIEAKKGYTLVTKNKMFIIGKVLVCPKDNEDYIEVKDTELVDIKKAIKQELAKIANEQ